MTYRPGTLGTFDRAEAAASRSIAEAHRIVCEAMRSDADPQTLADLWQRLRALRLACMSPADFERATTTQAGRA